MGSDRIDRASNPLAAMMEEELEGLEAEAAGEAGGGETSAAAIPESRPEAADGLGRRAPGGSDGVPRTGGLTRRSGRRPGRPKGGRNSDPNMVPISAKIHRDVRFALDRVLAEQSALAGRPVYMAEVIERLLRFYVEQGDPYEMLEDAR